MWDWVPAFLTQGSSGEQDRAERKESPLLLLPQPFLKEAL